MLDRYVAGQLAKPQGLIGRFVLGPLWNRRNRVLNDAAFDGLGLEPQHRALDVGFGGGYLLDRLLSVAAQPVCGVDASPAMVGYVARRQRRAIAAGRLDVRLAGADSLPFDNAAFDRLSSVNSLFYWPDLASGLAEMARVLAPGGRLVLVFTDKASLATKGFSREGLRLYEAAEIVRRLSALGFREPRDEPFRDRYRSFHRVTAAR